MAAVLCRGLGDICDGLCDALGTVICLPCKACGFACTEMRSFCKSPFALYLAVALGFNLPAVVFAAKNLGRNHEGGCASAASWLNVNAILCFVNMAAALYITSKIVHESDPLVTETVDAAPYIEASVFHKEAKTKTADPMQEATVVAPNKNSLGRSILNTTDTHNDTRAKSFARTKDVLMEDPIVAVYILIGLSYMIWSTIGIGRSASAYGCGYGLAGSVNSAVMCNFLFISLGGMAFACSICCLR
uniref:Uncharacterized protein n=1 Tax=Minutocellus polymorphus TaxID=265543 RepID=A0A7S0AZ66_9STRA|mmetsp:Transcript_7607/g.12597  ORF Transcript_7607/g.12597 Transcript_7607/m.12597 type:complete len:246 (+) Transcript_7607:83-820(+)|eukprot:CAMPEP_0197725432 /NCGR_PEP_ID=MMETSP1434-20131217/6972_1 /TAXON_ID=265543 /ORGANISM="Minutocellus polymorphus, Strain CCMP3303" /LENGTH=245 /DNA_ID=CAMNT_0043310905 /DNA_START=42 /DNA_END=779 /DNA_ORIENTATION=-